jgi:hypothetical protein
MDDDHAENQDREGNNDAANRTDDLRKVFTDVTGTDTATEHGGSDRGSLVDRDREGEAGLLTRLEGVVARMRERFEFGTDLDDRVLARLVQGVVEGADDDALAGRLGVDSETVFRARMDLHLVHETDFGGLDPDRLRQELGSEPDDDALAREFGVDAGTVERGRRALAARREARRVNDRFRDAFDDVLGDEALSTRLTDGTKEHGLEEAAEDIETDVKF